MDSEFDSERAFTRVLFEFELGGEAFRVTYRSAGCRVRFDDLVRDGTTIMNSAALHAAFRAPHPREAIIAAVASRVAR